MSINEVILKTSKQRSQNVNSQPPKYPFVEIQEIPGKGKQYKHCEIQFPLFMVMYQRLVVASQLETKILVL